MEQPICISKQQIGHVIVNGVAANKEIQNETCAEVGIIDGPNVKITGEIDVQVLVAKKEVSKIIPNQESPSREGPEGERLREGADALGAKRAESLNEAAPKPDADNHTEANKLVEETNFFGTAMEKSNDASAAVVVAVPAIAKYSNEDKGKSDVCSDMHDLHEEAEDSTLLKEHVAPLDEKPVETVTNFAVIAGAEYHSADGEQELNETTEENLEGKGITHSEEPTCAFTANSLGEEEVNAACGQEGAEAEAEGTLEEEKEIEPSAEKEAAVTDEELAETNQLDCDVTHLAEYLPLGEEKPSYEVISGAVYDKDHDNDTNDIQHEWENVDAVIVTVEKNKTSDTSTLSCGVQVVSQSDVLAVENSCDSETSHPINIHAEPAVDKDIITEEKNDECGEECAVEEVEEEKKRDGSCEEDANTTDKPMPVVDTNLVDEDEIMKESTKECVQEQKDDTDAEERREPLRSTGEDIAGSSHTCSDVNKQSEEVSTQPSFVIRHSMPDSKQDGVGRLSINSCPYVESNEAEEDEQTRDPALHPDELTKDEETIDAEIKEVQKEEAMKEEEKVKAPLSADSHLEDKNEEMAQLYKVPVHGALKNEAVRGTKHKESNKRNKSEKDIMSIPVRIDDAVLQLDAAHMGKHVLYLDEEDGAAVWKVVITAPLKREVAPEPELLSNVKNNLSCQKVHDDEMASVLAVEDVDEEALEFFDD